MPHYNVPLVGMHFRPPAKAFMHVLPQDHPLYIEPEPTNEFDPNALKVNIKSSEIPTDSHADLEGFAGGFGFDLKTILEQEIWHLGYIARDQAAALAPMLDTFDIKSAKLTFSGEGKPQVGLTLESKIKASP